MIDEMENNTKQSFLSSNSTDLGGENQNSYIKIPGMGLGTAIREDE